MPSFPRVSSFLGIAPAFALSAALALLGPLRLSARVDKTPYLTQTKGALVYQADKDGNRLPDFSTAGYGGGGVPLPLATARVSVTPSGGDDGARIQAAIDFVSQLPLGSDGLRGAVLLSKGSFLISGQIVIASSGVVLRGEGEGAGGTLLVATGTSRRALIDVRGPHAPAVATRAVAVADALVPLGALRLRLAEAAHGFKAGEIVVVQRPSTKEWIEALGMHEAPGPTNYFWRPGSVSLSWTRTITAVEGDSITLDSPLTTALERRFGGATVASLDCGGLLNRVGVENLRCEAQVSGANPQDEEHAWTAVSMDRVRDGWVNRVTGLHFAGSFILLGSACDRVTVQDCRSLAPVSELAGYRRHSFHSSGQRVLFLRCESERGRNDFTTGYQTAGPVVFLECTARESTGFSGSVGSWSSGLLFDNVNIDGGALRLDNLGIFQQGVGWSAANSVLWQCSASLVSCSNPPGARNYAFGAWGQFSGDGIWQSANAFVDPKSLYRAQLAQRLGPQAEAALAPSRFEAPTQPGVLALENAVPDLARRLVPAPPPKGLPVSLENGWLVAGGSLLTGVQAHKLGEVSWWRGQLAPARSGEEGPCLTRFAPGRMGPGLTDDLETVADAMVRAGVVTLRHHYGLWYDRRRDDHERVRRIDNELNPPFYELPWARSGSGRAWSGLTLYDLSAYNPWYFGRLREFAGLARERGLLLVNEMYFQHNILEAGAHWADFPWRPANCIQKTGFQEPPEYAGGKRIFMADTFYDLSDPVRRELHRAYVRQCLANLSGQPNVLHTLGEEYTGPLHFAQFWIDVAAEWKQETGARPLLCLSVTKEVQDALLADAKRAAVFSVIELKYWWLTRKGLFAPKGGQNLAPRQFEREWKGGRPSADTIASMIWAYRRAHPDKAVTCPFPEAEGWLTLAAGGSLPALPAGTAPSLLAALPRMTAVGPQAEGKLWLLAEPGRQFFAYLPMGGSASMAFPASGKLRLQSVNLKTGALLPGEPVDGGSVSLSAPTGSPAAFWASLL